MQREKRTKSGRLLEVDFYPVFSDGRRIPLRAPKTKRSTPEQEKYNYNKAVKKLIRLVNVNFDTGDILMHPTFTPENAPTSEEEARKILTNYFRRVKTKRASELKRITKLLEALPDEKDLQVQKKKLEEPFRYIYTIEKVTYKSGKHKGRDNWHFHLFMTGGLKRDVVEDMWSLDMRVNADRYQPERFGPEAASRYIIKDPQGTKRFSCSRNLKRPPEPKTKDGKITSRGVEKLAKERIDDKAYWERRHPGYRFVRCFARYNTFNGYWYVSVIMYKTSEPMPEWKIDDWLEE